MGNKKEKLKIFISYGHDDYLKRIQTIAEDLKTNFGYEVWIDKDLKEEAVKENLDIHVKMQKEIHDANRVVLFMSKHSMRQILDKNEFGYCLNEISYASEQKKRIVPVKLEESETYLPIAAIPYIDLTDFVKSDCFSNADKYNEVLNVIDQYIKEEKIIIGNEYISCSNYLIKKLRPFQFHEMDAKDQKKLYQRKWLVNKVRHWFNETNSKTLCLLGSSGSGKTKFVCSLCDTDLPIVNVHFCKFKEIETYNPNRVIMSLCYYLTTRNDQYKQKIYKYLKECEDEGIDSEKLANSTSTENLWRDLFINPLNEIQQGNGIEPMILVVDAVDEASDNKSIIGDSSNPLLELIRDCFNQTPDWLRLIITTRPEQNIQTHLQQFETISLDKNNEESFNDIYEYLSAELEPHIRKLSVVEKEQKLKKLVEKAHNNFLFASYMVEALNDGNNSEYNIDNIVEKFPSDLVNYYSQNFGNKLFPSGSNARSKYNAWFKPILQIVASLYEPLKLNKVRQIVNCSLTEKIEQDDFNLAITHLSKIFIVKDGYLEAPHKSLFDWLCNNDESKPEESCPRDFWIDRKSGHNKITKYFFNSEKDEDETYKVSYLEDHCFESENITEYASEILTDENLFNSRVKKLGVEKTIKSYFYHLKALWSESKKMTARIITSPLFIQIFSKYRSLLQNNAYYNLLEKIGFTDVANKIDINCAKLETISSLINYYSVIGNIVLSNELLTKTVKAFNNLDNAIQLEFMNNYAVMNLRQGNVDLANEITDKILSLDKDKVIEMLSYKAANSLISETIYALGKSNDVYFQMLSTVQTKGLIEFYKNNLELSLTHLLNAKKGFINLSECACIGKWEVGELEHYFKNICLLQGNTIPSIISLIFGLICEPHNAILYLNEWSWGENMHKIGELSNYSNIHHLAQMLICAHHNDIQTVLNKYSEIHEKLHNKYETIWFDFICSLAYSTVKGYGFKYKESGKQMLQSISSCVSNNGFSFLESQINELCNEIGLINQIKVNQNKSKYVDGWAARIHELIEYLKNKVN